MSFLLGVHFGQITIDKTIPYHSQLSRMKMQATLIMITLCLSLSTPLSISLSPANDHTYITTIDVCDALAGAVSVNADTPVLQEYSCTLCRPGLCEYSDVIDPTCKSSSMAFQIERPPRF